MADLRQQTRNKTQYIPDIFGEVVDKVATGLQKDVFYDWGHYQEVTKNLDEKSKNFIDKSKFPLIWLVMDFEQVMQPRPGIYADVALQIIIATDTSLNYTMGERRDNSFLPILYPIYWELINQMNNTRAFTTDYMMKHSLWERPYWGVEGKNGNGANLFNDFIDAIQLKNFKIGVRQAC